MQRLAEGKRQATAAAAGQVGGGGGSRNDAASQERRAAIAPINPDDRAALQSERSPAHLQRRALQLVAVVMD